MNKQELARVWVNKAKVLGIKIDITNVYGGGVRLNKVDGAPKIFKIPRFVTEFYIDSLLMDPIFCGEDIEYIEVDNEEGREISVKHLFSMLGSEKLKIKFSHPECIVDMEGMCCDCRELKEVKFIGMSTKNVTNVGRLFSGCRKLRKIDLGDLDTRNVKWMHEMFENCRGLKEINLSNINTDNVELMGAMFYGCESIEKLDLSNFVTDKVKSIAYMFCGCVNLKSLDISKFKTKEVMDMSGLFFSCERIEDIKLNRKFKIKEAAERSDMFTLCNDGIKEAILGV